MRRTGWCASAHGVRRRPTVEHPRRRRPVALGAARRPPQGPAGASAAGSVCGKLARRVSAFRRGAHARRSTAEFHHAARRHGSRLAARGARAAADAAGGWVPAQHAVDAVCESPARVPRGAERGGICRGHNVAIEQRYADNRPDRLPELADDLVRRKVSVIVGNSPAATAARAATATIPIVFVTGDDPVRSGLVVNLGRPGGNVTGVNFFLGELGAKQLGLLRELIPGGTRVAVLVNPSAPMTVEATLRGLEEPARAMGLQIQVLNAGTSREITTAFATAVDNRVDGLLINSDVFFYTRRLQLATLAARHAIPAIYNVREFADAGGLITYDGGVSAGRRLHGPHSQGREARRPPGHAVDQVRTRH
jgi:hypothetical protein